MSRLGQGILFTLLGLYLLVLQLDRSTIDYPLWLDHYAADLLCMPILLIMSTYLVRLTGLCDRLGLAHIFFTWAYVSLVFELLLPWVSSRYTADFYDVLAYVIGSLVFVAMQSLIFPSFISHDKATQQPST